MENKDINMQNIFNELSEKNKDIMILIAKSIKVAQESEQIKKPCKSIKQLA